MPTATNFLPQGLLKELFLYDPTSGILSWRIEYGKNKPGDAVGFYLFLQSRQRDKRASHALLMAFGAIYYHVHNLIWVYMTGRLPIDEVDHKNRIRNDNRWENLREATRSQNQANTGLYKNNKTGVRGVYFDNHAKCYKAVLSRDGKNKHLGYFDNLEDAALAWKAAAKALHGEFASA